MQEKICAMGIFIICAQAVIHFSPSKSYAKYLKLLLSMMVLVQLMQPIVLLVFGNSDSLQNLAGELWRDFDSGWSEEWSTVTGYEEQIDRILDQELGEYAQVYEQEYGETMDGTSAMTEQAEASDEAVISQTETGEEEHPVQISPSRIDPVVIQVEPAWQEEQ